MSNYIPASFDSYVHESGALSRREKIKRWLYWGMDCYFLENYPTMLTG
jgi:hypothetical protein